MKIIFLSDSASFQTPILFFESRLANTL